MKYLPVILFLLFSVGCSVPSGTITNNVYSSKGGLFQLPVPWETYGLDNGRLDDGSSEFDQVASFEIPYGTVHRVSRYRTGSNYYRGLDRTWPVEAQLEGVETTLFHLYENMGFQSNAVFERHFVIIEGQKILLEVRQLTSVKEHDQRFRAFAIFVTPNYVNILEYAHPMDTEKSIPLMFSALDKLYRSLRLNDK